MIVQCDMCYDLYNLKEWEESNIFICEKCSLTMEFIRKQEILQGYDFKNRLRIFDLLRRTIKIWDQ